MTSVIALPAPATEHDLTAAVSPSAALPSAVTLPSILSADDAELYRKIFAYQEKGNWRAADRAMAKLDDRRLVGHVLGDRYMSTRYRTPAAELKQWLAQYADHPDAPALYKLAGRRAPNMHVRRPVGTSMRATWYADDLGPPPNPPMPPGLKLGRASLARANSIKSQIGRKIRAGNLDGAERLLASRDARRLLSDGEEDHLKARMAAGWFALGNDERALHLADEAASRSGDIVPRANWIAGLSLFKQSRFAEAARRFEALARTPDGEPWDIAAGAFWASRTHARDRRFDQVNYWLAQAAEHPRTFYGLLAIRLLGIESPFNWDPPPLTEQDIEALRRTASGSRALALIQIGQTERAAAELRRAYASAGAGQMRTILAIAMQANMPGLSMQLGRELSELEGRRYDGALYPIPPWAPIGGYQIDRALVFAFMRQESQFNTKAVSHVGARGLMQLMPQTARFLEGSSFRGRAALVHDPAYNVTLGKRYIALLLAHEAVEGDLIRLAAAYNGGPGNLMRWTRKQDLRGKPEEDALLFIESLPAPETRHFITRILYGYWMYRKRLGQPTPSLDAIAAGEWPTYIAIETAEAKGPSPRHAEAR